MHTGYQLPNYDEFAYCRGCGKNKPRNQIRCDDPNCKNRLLSHSPNVKRSSKAQNRLFRYE